MYEISKFYKKLGEQEDDLGALQRAGQQAHIHACLAKVNTAKMLQVLVIHLASEGVKSWFSTSIFLQTL